MTQHNTAEFPLWEITQDHWQLFIMSESDITLCPAITGATSLPVQLSYSCNCLSMEIFDSFSWQRPVKTQKFSKMNMMIAFNELHHNLAAAAIYYCDVFWGKLLTLAVIFQWGKMWSSLLKFRTLNCGSHHLNTALLKDPWHNKLMNHRTFQWVLFNEVHEI